MNRFNKNKNISALNKVSKKRLISNRWNKDNQQTCLRLSGAENQQIKVSST